MRYTDLQGQSAQAELWSPGPLFGTVWAIRPDGVPVVIQATKAIQVPWELPALPSTDVDPRLLELAEDIMRRRRLSAAAKSKDWYQQKYIVKDGHKELAPPTDDEVNVARTIIAQANHNKRAHLVFTAAHSASTAISAKRFYEIWEADQEKGT
jgi:hypothetical protein